MPNRREFLKDLAGATAGISFVGCDWVNAEVSTMQSGAAARRRVAVGGRQVKTVDVHCHCHVPEVWDLVKDYDMGQSLREQFDSPIGEQINIANRQERLRLMDEQGIDVQAVSINPFWYSAEQDLAGQIIKLQNEKIAELCSAHPDRFVGLATVALQHPNLAAEQLEEGVRRLGLRGSLIAGSVNGEELSDPKFHPFWAKAEELGTLIFIHPRGFELGEQRFLGNGRLRNVIGNPLETTVALSHLIFEGTLDRFPGLKICAAHGGGFLASYIGRSDHCVEYDNCKPVKKLPSQYLKQLYFDSLVFSAQGLRHLIAEAGVSQILLGTDFPYGMGNSRAVDHILDTSGLSDADRRAILGDNAAELLRIGS